MTRQYYKRGWTHSKTRGRESVITCSFCGRKVPRYKTFAVTKGFSITDPFLKGELGIRGRRGMMVASSRMHACPACARHRSIVRKKR
jgi:ribosomal protein S26